MNFFILKKSNLLLLFLTLFLFELFLFGSGRPLVIGGVTMRMVFYMLSISIAFLFIFRRSIIQNNDFVLLFSFCFLLVFSSLVGIINGASPKNVLNDVLPLLYFFVITFFGCLVKYDQRFINCWVSTLMKASLILAILYFVFLAAIFFGVVSFSTAYQYLSSDSNEVMFRGVDSSSPGIFYKSFIFLVIGFFFFYFSKSTLNKLLAALIFIAVLFTLTRGFILCIFVVAYFFLVIEANLIKKISFLIFSCLLFFYLVFFTDMLSLVLRPDSDAARYLQFREVIEMVTIESIFVGHGFGIGTESRPNNFEVTYLEILHKQGLLGLIFWIGVFIYMAIKFWYLKNEIAISKPIFAGVLVIYIQTFTNPYLINSMGIGYLALAFVSLNMMSRTMKMENYERIE